MYRRVTFESQAFEDYVRWQTPSMLTDQSSAGFINDAIRIIQLYGHERASVPVTYESEDAWSRHLFGKHHLIYQLSSDEMRILSCRHRKTK